MTTTGERDRLILFERATVSTDDYGGETETWAEYAKAFAKVLFGSGQERREAAQERAEQAATFKCGWNPTVAGVALTDRIQFDGAAWDITSRVPARLNKEIHFTAVRAA